MESKRSLSIARTRIVVNSDVVPTAAFQFDRDLDMRPQSLLERLRGHALPGGVIDIDAKQLSGQLLGDSIGANMMMVGIALQSGLLPVGLAAIEEAIRLNGVAVAFNLEALQLGRLLAFDRDMVLRSMQSTPAKSLPVTLDEVIAHRAQHLRDYQDEALRDRYLNLVSRVRAAAGDGPVAMAVARNYAKLLAYKDEYEVARLLTHPELRAELTRTFEDGGRIAFNLAPPLLSGRQKFGRPRKRAFARWIVPLLALIARARFVRGTAFDPFGRTGERRMERALIGEYEALVEAVLGKLNQSNATKAAELLGLADAVRGYGPIKEKAVARYREAASRALADFLATAAPGAVDRPRAEVPSGPIKQEEFSA